MNSLHLWMVAKNHKMLSRKLNTHLPVHVPIVRNIDETKVEMIRETFPRKALITDIKPPAKLLMSEPEDYFIGFDCVLFEQKMPLLIYEVFSSDITNEEVREIFPELETPGEELEAILCLARRSMDHPFVYELMELED